MPDIKVGSLKFKVSLTFRWYFKWVFVPAIMLVVFIRSLFKCENEYPEGMMSWCASKGVKVESELVAESDESHE